MPHLIDTATRKIKKREQVRTETKERLEALFVERAGEDRYIKRTEILEITGGDHSLRREVLTDLEAKGMFFRMIASDTKTADRGDWRLASPEWRLAKAQREAGKLSRTAGYYSTMSKSAEPDLDAIGRIRSRAVTETLETVHVLCGDDSVQEVADTIRSGGDAQAMVAVIIGRPRYR